MPYIMCLTLWRLNRPDLVFYPVYKARQFYLSMGNPQELWVKHLYLKNELGYPNFLLPKRD